MKIEDNILRFEKHSAYSEIFEILNKNGIINKEKMRNFINKVKKMVKEGEL